MLSHSEIKARLKSGPIETGWKAFDTLANKQGIFTGNVSGDAQFSGFIRPSSELECNGRTNPPRHLQDFDLAPFIRAGIPRLTLDAVRARTDACSGTILYRVQHFRRKERLVHGYVLTAKDGKRLATFTTNAGRQHFKSAAVVEAFAAFVSWRAEDHPTA